ncbi:MAG TPA: DUF2339 domain-containing protein [Thermoanaerobaculia bacterium]|nr:DUF2339 domain-containing protein [Thermoanaerobaculia bacterium]
MLGNQQTVTSALAERIASLRRALTPVPSPGPPSTPSPGEGRPLPPVVEKQVEAAPEPLTPVPSPIALPSPGRGAPPPFAVSSPLSRSGGSAMGEGGQGGEEPAPPPRPPAPPPSVRLPKPSLDWENLVGVRLFSWMAGITLAIAAIFFLRHSIQHGWLSAPVRMAIGILTGAGLLVLCEWKAARRYPVTANALDAAGIAILFSTIFASHSLWNLLGATPAFLLMALVAAVAVALAIRRDSPFIALLGLLGGFATPALLSTGEDRPFGLFGYLLLLNAGLAWVALSRRWVILIRLALAFTLLYQWAWVFRFLDPGRIPLAFGIFLIFPILYLIAPAVVRRSESDEEPFWQVASLSAGLPLLLAVYLAAAPGFGDHYGLLFGYLLLLGAGLAVFAAVKGPSLLQAAGAGATVLVYALWLGVSYRSDAWPELLAFLSAEVLLYLAAPWVSGRMGGKLLPSDGTFAAPLLLGAFPALILLEPATTAPGLIFGVLFLLLLATAAFAILYESAWLHLGAAFFAVAAEAIWSGRHLTPERLLPGLALYAVFGLFYLGVPIAARRWGCKSLYESSAVYVGLIEYLFLLFVAVQPDLSKPPWLMFGTLALLVLAAGIAALWLRRGGLQVASLVTAQAIVLVWMLVAEKEPWLSVALVATAVLVVFSLAWILLARRREEAPGSLTNVCAKGAVVALFMAQAISAVAGLPAAGPSMFLALPIQAGLAILLLSLARKFTWLAPVSAMTSFLAAFAYWNQGDWEHVALGTVLLLIYLAYPLVLGRRAEALHEPWLGAVVASVAYFFLAYWNLDRLGFGEVIGLLPVLQAAALAFLLWRLLSLEPPQERDLGRLALVAGAVLAFITVAIPLQLEKQWITIGWALLAAALAWLFTRIPHRGLLWWIAGLAAAVFIRLSLNPAVLSYHPRAALPIWNWYLYTYLVAAAALLAAAWFLSRTDDRIVPAFPRLSTLASAAGGVLLFLLLNIEIADSFSTGPALTFSFLSGQATLAEGLTYTLAWGIFALALLVTGIAIRSRGARIAAIGLLLATVLKGFLLDLAALGGLYRVASFVGLAVCLAAVAVLIQKFVILRAEEGEG